MWLRTWLQKTFLPFFELSSEKKAEMPLSQTAAKIFLKKKKRELIPNPQKFP